jgi:hypothetical protein
MTQIKLALALVAALVWAAGYYFRNDVLTWIGIGILVVAVLLRFVKGSGNTPL